MNRNKNNEDKKVRGGLENAKSSDRIF